eukprot:CAMPEP_0113877378 /NCGR_PEP_ID=MMETSP0780_2-20120614/6059_1 /TAXON_ID=652834 /ORGANISM="Palpitomonas bilix" /LENGTH=569 /DNA_ID=CAMNT_0000863661 /DNA_START=12 /DNA_END=1721 /DNA_ORIENTATION=+ /assembly_acc=CAM_ASM_000599
MPLTLAQVEARFQDLEDREDKVRSYFRPALHGMRAPSAGRHRFADVLEEDPFSKKVKQNREYRKKSFASTAKAVGLIPNDEDSEDDLSKMIQSKQDWKRRRPQSSPGTLRHLTRAASASANRSGSGSGRRGSPTMQQQAVSARARSNLASPSPSSRALPSPGGMGGRETGRRVQSAAVRRTPNWDKHAVTGAFRDVGSSSRPATASSKTMQQRVDDSVRRTWESIHSEYFQRSLRDTNYEALKRAQQRRKERERREQLQQQQQQQRKYMMATATATASGGEVGPVWTTSGQRKYIMTSRKVAREREERKREEQRKHEEEVRYGPITIPDPSDAVRDTVLTGRALPPSSPGGKRVFSPPTSAKAGGRVKVRYEREEKEKERGGERGVIDAWVVEGGGRHGAEMGEEGRYEQDERGTARDESMSLAGEKVEMSDGQRWSRDNSPPRPRHASIPSSPHTAHTESREELASPKRTHAGMVGGGGGGPSPPGLSPEITPVSSVHNLVKPEVIVKKTQQVAAADKRPTVPSLASGGGGMSDALKRVAKVEGETQDKQQSLEELRRELRRAFQASM